METIAQAAGEAARVVVQDMAVMRTGSNDRMQNVIPKLGSSVMQQPTFKLGSRR